MYQLLIVLLQNVNIIDKLKLVWYFYQIAREWNVRKTEALGRFNHSPISTELSFVRYNKKKRKKKVWVHGFQNRTYILTTKLRRYY